MGKKLTMRPINSVVPDAILEEGEALLAAQREISGLTGEDEAMAAIAADPGSDFAAVQAASIGGIADPIPYTTSPSRVTDATIVGAGNRNPNWLSNDGTRIFCGQTTVLYWSDDELSTVVTSIDMAAAGASGGIQAVREDGAGELLLFMGSSAGTVWRTNGYNDGAAGPLAFTASKVLTFDTASAGPTNNWGVWVDPDEGIAAVMEYDTDKTGASSARYGYLSKNNGQTWVKFFDRYTSIPGDTVTTGLHPHGIAYDPIDDVWIATGGDDHDYIAVCANWRSAGSLGAFTWDLLNYSTDVNGKFQCVGIYPLEKCILFGSDGWPNGVQRIRRTNPDGTTWLNNPVVENAYRLDSASTIRYLAGQLFRARHIPTAPLLIGFNPTGSVLDRSRVLLTMDGFSFTEIWREQANYSSTSVSGIQSNLGPTVGHGYVFCSRRDGSGSNRRVRFTLPDIVQAKPSQSGRYGIEDEDPIHPGLIRAPYAHRLMGPGVPGLITVPGTAVSLAAALVPVGARVVAPRRGRIAYPHINVGTQNGNIELSLYTGANPRALLWTSGSIACPASGWAEIATDIDVTCEAGDEFVWYLTADGTTATFARMTGAIAGLTVLPADLSPNTGASYKLLERLTTAQGALGTMASTIADGLISSGITNGPLVVARII